jgi:hypothetical protein
MPSPRNICLLAVSSLALLLNAQAQQPGQPAMQPPGQQSAKASASASAVVDDAFIQKQFGSTCKLMPGPPPLVADLDADGIEDVVIAARCTNPLLDQGENNYKVIDPYNTYFGYGDPKVSTQFASEDPATRGLVLLVIHGAGPEAWRAETPKAKFIIINLPFKEVMVKKMTFRKRTLTAIFAAEAHEGEGTVSAVFWDGKKYRYQPIGSSME